MCLAKKKKKKKARTPWLPGPEFSNVAEGYEQFRPKDFLVGFWSLHLKKKKKDNKKKNNNNGSSDIEKFGTTVQTLQLLKPPQRQPQQHSNNMS